jgi:hypothetical protein
MVYKRVQWSEYKCLRKFLFKSEKSYQFHKKRADLFDEASDKLEQNLDAARMIKNIQSIKVIKSIVMRRHNKKLIKYFRSNTFGADMSEDEKVPKT